MVDEPMHADVKDEMADMSPRSKKFFLEDLSI